MTNPRGRRAAQINKNHHRKRPFRRRNLFRPLLLRLVTDDNVLLLSSQALTIFSFTSRGSINPRGRRGAPERNSQPPKRALRRGKILRPLRSRYVAIKKSTSPALTAILPSNALQTTRASRIWFRSQMKPMRWTWILFLRQRRKSMSAWYVVKR